MNKPIEFVLYTFFKDGIPFYVGITKNFEQRMQYHKLAIKNPDKQYFNNKLNKTIFPHKTYLYNKLRTIIEKDPTFSIDENVEKQIFGTYEELKQGEINLIKKYKAEKIELCNLTDGGEGTPGHKPVFTDEWRKKLSEAKRKYFDNGGKNSFAGKKHSIETLNKIAETRKLNGKNANSTRIGKTNVEIFGVEKAALIAKKISNGNKNKPKPHTKEWEEKRIAALRGKTKNGNKYKISYNSEYSIIWDKSLYAFAESIGQNGDKFYVALKRGTPTRDGWLVERLPN